MSEKTVEYGPFTPQELDSLVRELQSKNIPFEIAKDEKTEKEFKAIDFGNLVTQTEFRTKQYMAQIFYITLAKKDVPKISTRLENLGFSAEFSEGPAEGDENPREDIFNKAKREQKNFNRRLIAWLFVLGLFCMMVIGFAI